ncbi:MAG: hypothetical protein ACTSP2_00145 [Alphaproteobacteria bacterium]
MANGNEQLSLARSDGSAPRVLLGGGTPAQATVAAILATQFGCDIRYVGSCGDLLSALRSTPAADLVVLDQAHPHGAGALWAPTLRAEAQRRGLPFVRLGGAMTRRAGRSLEGVVDKPYSPRELFAAMQSALAQTDPAASAT